jgi:hypothetical protein
MHGTIAIIIIIIIIIIISSALFWDIMQSRDVIRYRRLGITYLSHLKVSRKLQT